MTGIKYGDLKILNDLILTMAFGLLNLRIIINIQIFFTKCMV